jgi:hypothetical protein
MHDHHGFDVEAFETKPRAGYTIPEVVEGMARGNALALLVLTPEDEQPETIRARESVVHEVGYFQGRLGNKRSILLMKEGVNEFSNVHGSPRPLQEHPGSDGRSSGNHQTRVPTSAEIRIQIGDAGRITFKQGALLGEAG